MSRFYSLFIIILFVNVSFSQIPPGYYDPAQGLSGEPLRVALFNIINGHTEQTYTSLWTHFQSTDNNGGIVWDMYSDIPAGTPSYTYSFGVDQDNGTLGNAEGDWYNREHSVPQSWFGSATPMQSDLFHLYPTDKFVNASRGDFPYGEVGSVSYTFSNGSLKGTSNYPGYSGTVFEPIDAYKGDFARTYFYMMTRYKNNVSTWVSPMFSSDNLSTWAKTMLVSWDALDPVDQKEIDRNNAVYTIQGNRNPFIDNPQWVDWIWGPAASVGELEKPMISMSMYMGGLKIQNETQKTITLNVVNMVGANVLKVEIYPGTNEVELSLAKGVYVAWSSVDGEVSTFKFVK